MERTSPPLVNQKCEWRMFGIFNLREAHSDGRSVSNSRHLNKHTSGNGKSRISSDVLSTVDEKYPDVDQRRQRIDDNLKALHELLPTPDVGSQACILDDIIDYVKYLQIQVKELSESKLQADSNAISLVFHEGYGHYIKEQMLNEPLEEIMGKLLEVYSAATCQLLENKGLVLLPIALVDELNQAMQC